MQEAYKLARKATEAAAKWMETRSEQEVTGANPQEGDVVLVRNLGFKGSTNWQINGDRIHTRSSRSHAKIFQSTL